MYSSPSYHSNTIKLIISNVNEVFVEENLKHRETMAIRIVLYITFTISSIMLTSCIIYIFIILVIIVILLKCNLVVFCVITLILTDLCKLIILLFFLFRFKLQLLCTTILR